MRWLLVFALQIENLQEQLRDKEKQMSSLRERVKSLQADTSNTDTALTTLEESLAEKVTFEIVGMLIISWHVKLYCSNVCVDYIRKCRMCFFSSSTSS